MEASFEEYFDTSNDVELHDNALENIGDHYKDSFLQLIVDLKESLTGDERKRGRATELIYSLLEKQYINVDMNILHHLIAFFLGRLDDYPSLAPSMKGISAIVQIHDDLLTKGDSVKIIDAFLRINVQALTQSVRSIAFRIILELLNNNMVLSSDFIDEKAIHVIEVILISMEGEKDPRCLLLALKTVQRTISKDCLGKYINPQVYCNPNLTEDDEDEDENGKDNGNCNDEDEDKGKSSQTMPLAERIFESLACYFPITFTPPPDDPYGINPTDLATLLLESMATHKDVMSYTIRFLMEKLRDARENSMDMDSNNEDMDMRSVAHSLVCLCYCLRYHEIGFLELIDLRQLAEEVFPIACEAKQTQSKTTPPSSSSTTNTNSELLNYPPGFIVLQTIKTISSVIALTFQRDADESGQMYWETFGGSLIDKCLNEIRTSAASIQAQRCVQILCSLASGAGLSAQSVMESVVPVLIDIGSKENTNDIDVGAIVNALKALMTSLGSALCLSGVSMQGLKSKPLDSLEPSILKFLVNLLPGIETATAVIDNEDDNTIDVDDFVSGAASVIAFFESTTGAAVRYDSARSVAVVNSLYALLRCVELGIGSLEDDVHVTSDAIDVITSASQTATANREIDSISNWISSKWLGCLSIVCFAVTCSGTVDSPTTSAYRHLLSLLSTFTFTSTVPIVPALLSLVGSSGMWMSRSVVTSVGECAVQMVMQAEIETASRCITAIVDVICSVPMVSTATFNEDSGLLKDIDDAINALYLSVKHLEEKSPSHMANFASRIMMKPMTKDEQNEQSKESILHLCVGSIIRYSHMISSTSLSSSSSSTTTLAASASASSSLGNFSELLRTLVLGLLSNKKDQNEGFHSIIVPLQEILQQFTSDSCESDGNSLETMTTVITMLANVLSVYNLRIDTNLDAEKYATMLLDCINIFVTTIGDVTVADSTEQLLHKICENVGISLAHLINGSKAKVAETIVQLGLKLNHTLATCNKSNTSVASGILLGWLCRGVLARSTLPMAIDEKNEEHQGQKRGTWQSHVLLILEASLSHKYTNSSDAKDSTTLMTFQPTIGFWAVDTLLKEHAFALVPIKKNGNSNVVVSPVWRQRLWAELGKPLLKQVESMRIRSGSSNSADGVVEEEDENDSETMKCMLASLCSILCGLSSSLSYSAYSAASSNDEDGEDSERCLSRMLMLAIELTTKSEKHDENEILLLPSLQALLMHLSDTQAHRDIAPFVTKLVPNLIVLAQCTQAKARGEALRCLIKIAQGEMSYSRLFPMKLQVIRGLRCVLDDRKRAVRLLAARTINSWELLE